MLKYQDDRGMTTYIAFCAMWLGNGMGMAGWLVNCYDWDKFLAFWASFIVGAVPFLGSIFGFMGWWKGFDINGFIAFIMFVPPYIVYFTNRGYRKEGGNDYRFIEFLQAVAMGMLIFYCTLFIVCTPSPDY